MARRGGEFGGVTILIAGIIIGSLSTILWQGAETPDGFGAGIRNIIEGFFADAPENKNKNKTTADAEQTPAAKPSVDFDFFAELPGIEVLIVPQAPDGSETAAAETESENDRGSYILQAASYQNRADAEELKATLALGGMKSKIQKVSIQGRGDFYRVRLGPYQTYQAMDEADARLVAAGINDALRLKIKAL